MTEFQLKTIRNANMIALDLKTDGTVLGHMVTYQLVLSNVEIQK